MEEQSLREKQPRVKFAANYKGTLEVFFEKYPAGRKQFESLCFTLRDNLWDLEYHGVAPVLPDGKVCQAETKLPFPLLLPLKFEINMINYNEPCVSRTNWGSKILYR